MSKPIRLVLSDIDGTLVHSDKSLSDGVVAAVGRLKDAGIPFSLISARPPSGMLWIAERLGLSEPLGAFNGGTIVKPDGTIVSAARMDDELGTTAVRLLAWPEVSLWLFAEGKWFASDGNNPHVPHEVLSAGVDPVLFSHLSEIPTPVDKIVGVCDDPDLLRSIETRVHEALGERATVARSQTYYLDITAASANKGDGVAALAEAMGVPLDQVAVLGDQRNDLPMFARAGFSVAMGQGPEEVRAAATRTTVSNDEDGVAHAIDDILLPMLRDGAPDGVAP